MLYQCPLCAERLNQDRSTFRCSNNHQFDIAKEGYINLIPANKKRSKNPGDNAEMMQARRRFLGMGYYAQMREKVAQLCVEKLRRSTQENTSWSALDIGCGEGYYSSELANKLTLSDANSLVYGLDISKVAIRYAAKKYPHCRFSVASSQRLPFLDNSLDLVLRIYAPCNPIELSRCLKNNGIVVTVTPAKRHLYQLRELIYKDVRLHDEHAESLDGFDLEHEEKLNYLMNLKNSDSLDLLQMTPFAWKATDDIKQKLLGANNFCCDAEFIIRVYRKK